MFLLPSQISWDVTYADKVRHEFRRKDDSFDYKILATHRIDTALTVLRKLSTLWSMYSKVEVSTDSESSFELPSIQTTAAVFPGVTLIAHPLLPGPLHRSVVLILDHTSKGSYGIVINKPSNHTISSAVKNVSDKVYDTFGSKLLHFGGRERRFQVIHSVPECGGTPIPNCSRALYAGGDLNKLIDYCEHVDNVKLEDKDEFHFYAGACLWKGDDLAKEIESGFWIPVVSQPDLLLETVWKNEKESKKIRFLEESNESDDADDFNDDSSDSDSDISTTSVNADFPNEDFASDELEGIVVEEEEDTEPTKDLWTAMLENLGPDYKQFSLLPTWSDVNSVESVDLK